MKKLALALAAAGSLLAMPAVAEPNDPFVSTQGGFGAGMAGVAITTVAVLIVASDGS